MTSRLRKLIKELASWVLIVLAIFSAAFGIKGFLLSSHFIDGGITGISILVANVLRLDPPAPAFSDFSTWICGANFVTVRKIYRTPDGRVSHEPGLSRSEPVENPR